MQFVNLLPLDNIIYNEERIPAIEASMKQKSGVKRLISDELYRRKDVDRKIVKAKKAWDEINKILNSSKY
jgi:L-fucose isomerase-like protein